MVGVINPNKSVSLQHQRELAKKSDYMLQPGDPFPAEASSSLASLISAEATEAPTYSPTSTPSSTATPTPATPAVTTSKKSGLSVGAAVGIAIGSAAVALLFAALLYFVRRSRKLAEKVKYGNVNVVPTNGAQQPPQVHKSPTIVDTGDPVYVQVKRSDLRNSTFSSAYGDVPPYDGDMGSPHPGGGRPHQGTGSPRIGSQTPTGYVPNGLTRYVLERL
jgi:hypothetical protein